MELNEYNKKAIDDTYKNAHIALQSISDILPAIDDNGLLQELKQQYEGYENVIRDITAYMKQNDALPKDINPFKKAMLWSSIKVKTLFNDSKNNIAEMMLKGTDMGIIELQAMLNESQNLEEDVKGLIQKLLHLEEEYQQRLKKYL